MVIRHSIGADATERAFFAANRRRLRVRSARRPQAKVRVERARPMIVRYWKCQP
jgi:hypothetical protein